MCRENISIQSIEGAIHEDPRARSVHHAYVWSLDGERHVLSAHIVVDPETIREEAAGIKRPLRDHTLELGVDHMTIEVEWGEGDCSLRPGTAHPHGGDESPTSSTVKKPTLHA